MTDFDRSTETKYVYYLAHPFVRNPSEAIQKAREWTYLLRQRRLCVFSPVMHSYDFQKWLNRTHRDHGLMHYVDWDLQLIQHLGKNMILLLSNTAYTMNDIIWKITTIPTPAKQLLWLSRGCQREYEYARANDITVLQLEPFVEKSLCVLMPWVQA